MKRVATSLLLLLLLALRIGASEEDLPVEVYDARHAKTPAKIKLSLERLEAFYQAESYGQIKNVSEALLANKLLQPKPRRARLENPKAEQAKELAAYNRERLRRQLVRERLLFYRARALLGLSEDPPKPQGLKEAETEFRKLALNVKDLPPADGKKEKDKPEPEPRFADPRYRDEAQYWLGRTYLAQEEPATAAETFQKLLDSGTENADLIANATRYLSIAKMRQSEKVADDPELDAQEKRKRRDSLLDDAARQLNNFVRDFQESPHRDQAELQLMELQLRLGRFADVEALARSFIRRADPGTPERALAAYYRAQSFYWEGEIDRAAELYEAAEEEEKPDPETLTNILFGLGWTNAQRARTAGPVERAEFLNKAHNALAQAWQRMAHDPSDNRRWLVARELTRVLIAQGEYEQALVQVQHLLGAHEMAFTAHFLAGQAARGCGRIETARDHFREVVERATRNADQPYVLEALAALAEIAYQSDRYAEAFEYHRRAERNAVRYRDFNRVAAARLGMAHALLELRHPDDARTEAAVAGLATALIRQMQAAAHDDPQRLRVTAEEIAFRLHVLGEWTGAGKENLRRARRMLDQLRVRLAAQLRKDELDYVEGQALFYRAEMQRAAMPFSINTNPDAYKNVFKLYDDAAQAVEAATVANPRGALAPRINFLLGRIHYRAGMLSLELSRTLKRQGRGTEAVRYESEADTAFEQALDPLLFVIRSSDRNVKLRADGRELLGETYLKLRAYEKGLVQFKALQADPFIPPARRAAAVRRWAEALDEMGRKEQAIHKLEPDIETHLASAIQAGKLLLETGQPRQARQVLLLSLQKNRDNDPELRAAALYHAHAIGLEYARAIAGDEGALMLEQESEQKLLELVNRYPQTPWANKAMLTLGRFLLGRGDWQRALAMAEETDKSIRLNPDAVDTLIAALLMKGRALAAGRKYDPALSALNRATLQKSDNLAGLASKAAATREQGTIYETLGQTDQALTHYQRVFVVYSKIWDEADAARIAVAEILQQRGDEESLRRALRILENGHDPGKMRPFRVRIEKSLQAKAYKSIEE